MSTTTSIPRRALASLHLSASKVPALVNYAHGIVQSMTGNAAFPSPTPPLSAVTSAINDLATAETAALARTRGAVVIRDEKRAALVVQLQALRAYVQSIADASPPTAASIIESAGMSLRKAPVRPPRVFNARPGSVSGAVKLVAAAASRRASYEWQSSVDAAKTWVAAPSTLQAKTTVTGLSPGATALFRYRAVTVAGEGDWSQPVSLIVK